MTDNGQLEEPVSPEHRMAQNAPALAALAALAVLLAIGGYWLGMRRSAGPGANAPEVGFARDMRTHHAQAVDLATLLRDRTDDPDLRQVALDIMLTQQAQIGQMLGWLTVWGHPVASISPAMEWMGMPTTGRMPGMASPEQLNQLRGLEGSQAEALFLQLMIPHHRGGVAMAQAILDRTQRPEVRALAQSIVEAQTSEIALMQELLQQRGLPPEGEGEMTHPMETP